MDTKPGVPQTHTRPFFGVFAVLLGACLATCFGRLLSVGAPDLRGALGLSADSASWITTSYNMGLMFIGPFSVYLGGLLGPRRVLLACATIFTFCCVVMPFSGQLGILIFFLVLTGLAAGTFYSLTLSFLLRNLPQRYVHWGIVAYAVDIVVTTHVAHSYEGWLITYLSWQWIFWTFAFLTPIMIFLVARGIPTQPLPQPKPGQQPPNWRGFLYASLGASLLYGALDQGQRMDWWRSGSFVALVATGAFLIMAAAVRHFMQPNPLVNFPFLRQWNILLLGVIVVLFRFGLLASVVLVPSYLSAVRGYRPEQTGTVLLWLAIPEFAAGCLAIYLLGRIDSRVVLAIGFALIAVGCLMNARITSAWSGNTFDASQLVLALGEGFAFCGVVGSTVLEFMGGGALQNAAAALSFSGFFQTCRLFGGELGSTFIQFFLHEKQIYHFDLLASRLDGGASPVVARTHLLAAGMSSHAVTRDLAAGRSVALFAASVKQQAFVLAIEDSFTLLAYAAVTCLLLIVLLHPLKVSVSQLIAAGEANNPSS